ncbi:uncharacterized protein LOC127701071 [Mytilus californianus]|uniref:uncharacterized protein LOC127701071 n=1 Tax=Mytilus californianus TaxID=6549 RepID=UPI002246E4D8|nr:uncharacterized protein LOC127701071 [Mytilus californianus]
MDVFVFISLYACLVKAVFSDQYPEIRCIVGDSVYLPCRNILGNRIIQWLNLNGNRDTSTGIGITYTDGWRINNKLPFHERLRIIGEEGGEKYDLEISNSSFQDAGLYCCTVDTVNETLYNYVRLAVKEYKWTTELIKTETTNSGEEKPMKVSSERTVNVDVVSDIMISDETSTGFASLQIYIIAATTSGIIIFVGIVAFVIFQAQSRYVDAIKIKHSNSRIDVDRESPNGRNSNENNYESTESSPRSQRNPTTFERLSNNEHSGNVFNRTVTQSSVDLPEIIEHTSHNAHLLITIDTSSPYQPLSGNWQTSSHNYDECIPKTYDQISCEENLDDRTHVYDECASVNVYETLVKEQTDIVNDHMYL